MRLHRALGLRRGRFGGGGVGAQHSPGTAHLQHDDRERVGDEVVDVACEPGPLLLRGDGGEPGVRGPQL